MTADDPVTPRRHIDRVPRRFRTLSAPTASSRVGKRGPVSVPISRTRVRRFEIAVLALASGRIHARILGTASTQDVRPADDQGSSRPETSNRNAARSSSSSEANSAA